MTQLRIYDFGALLTQGRAKALSASLFTPGIYEGFEPTIINATTVELSAGTYLLPNGILVRESAVTTITVATPGSAEDYTVIADHDDVQAIGGSAAYYTKVDGIKARQEDPNANSLSLLWIRHPGSAPLSADMLSVPPTLQAGTLLSAIEDGYMGAPFPRECDVLKGANIVATQQSRTAIDGTTTATLAAAVSGAIVVTGLTGMSAGSVGNYLSLTGATSALNNGLFSIVAYNSATSVDISDHGSAPGSDTASWQEKDLENLGLQITNSAVSGLQTYQFRLPLPPRPLPKSIEIYADIPANGAISIDTHPYVLFTAGGTVLSTTPGTVNGAVTALDPAGAAAGTYVLGNYDEQDPPSSLGVTVTVPPATAGVFIKGFNLVGD